MIVERVLLDDGLVTVADLRCVDAPAAVGAEERAPTATVVIPLDGVFLRTFRRLGSRGRAAVAIGDPTRALIFRPDEPYRVAHPAGSCDRCLNITVPGVPLDDGISERPIPGVVTLAARRLARGLEDGALDGLAGAEIALALVGAVAATGGVTGPGAIVATGSRAPRRPRDVAIVARTRFEIAARLGDRLTLPELGARVGLSGWELARRFRRETGSSIHRYRTGLRVQAALERIDAGERDLTGLALDLGFADHSHLSNVLRRETGRAPSAFRRPPTVDELGGLRTNLQA